VKNKNRSKENVSIFSLNNIEERTFQGNNIDAIISHRCFLFVNKLYTETIDCFVKQVCEEDNIITVIGGPCKDNMILQECDLEEINNNEMNYFAKENNHITGNNNSNNIEFLFFFNKEDFIEKFILNLETYNCIISAEKIYGKSDEDVIAFIQ